MGNKVLVLAYAVSPTRGSEYSLAWNYIREMSKENSLTVLYGVSGDHMGEVEEIDDWLKSNAIPNVTFVSVLPNRWTSFLNILNVKGIFPYSFYLSFRSWQRQVYDKARELLDHERFDLVHNLNPIGYREPGYLWKLGLPYIWGPIGGIPNRPAELFDTLPLLTRVSFTLRNWANTIQFNTNKRVKKAILAADLLLASTRENKALIEQKFGKQAIYIPENCIVNEDFGSPRKPSVYREGETFNLFWVGRIDANKALSLLIEALGKIKNDRWHLHVIGDGPLAHATRELAQRRGIDAKITWHGHVSRDDVLRLFESAHLHIICSLGEATTTVLFEAMAKGVPTLTLDHCGMKDVVCTRCGIKVDIRSSTQVIDELALSIHDLINDPDKNNELAMGVRECAKAHTWEKRRKIFNDFYDVAIRNHKSRCQP